MGLWIPEFTDDAAAFRGLTMSCPRKAAEDAVGEVRVF